MADEILQNKRIDQLELGVPVAGDFGVYRDMVEGKTKKFALNPASPTTDNFEWTSTAATAGDYDIDDVVTKGGKWWQSTINNNPNVPGVDATWTELTRSPSGFVKWTAGVFVEDEVFVWNTVGTTILIFRLKNITRPYVSSNFATELEADHWEVVGKLELVSVVTSGGTITLDMLSLPELAFVGATTIAGNKIVEITHDATSVAIKFFRFTVDAAGRTLSFLNTVNSHEDWDGAWDSPTGFVWTSKAAGTYELIATRAGAGVWNFRIYGTF